MLEQLLQAWRSNATTGPTASKKRKHNDTAGASGSSRDQDSSSSCCGLQSPKLLASMLAFLGLPGPVCKWLRCETFSLRNARALQFLYQSLAHDAAELMLDHKPHFAPSNGFDHLGLVSFLVCAKTAAASESAPLLSIHVLALQQNVVASIIKALDAHEASAEQTEAPALQYVELRARDVVPIPSDTTLKALPVSSDSEATSITSGNPATFTLGRQAVGCQAGVGKLLYEALHAATAGTPVTACVCQLKISHSYGPTSPIWVLRW